MDDSSAQSSLDLSQILHILQKKESDDKRRLELLKNELSDEKRKTDVLRSELATKDAQLQQKEAILRQLQARKAKASQLLKQAREVLDGGSNSVPNSTTNSSFTELDGGAGLQ
jgi:C1A family cysteine protease